jgi:shikimate 5-dehydrogenase
MIDVGTPIQCPVDYAVFEFPDHETTGDTARAILDLVDSGTIRLYDIAALRKSTDGTVSGFELSAFPISGDASFADLNGAQSGILDDDDIVDAAAILEPGKMAVLVVYENVWATPFVAAADRAGGRLLAGGRILMQSLVESLDALDESATSQDS